MDKTLSYALSWMATILFGVVALLGIVIAAVVIGDKDAMVSALLACGAAYIAQHCFTAAVQVSEHPKSAMAWGAAGLLLQGTCLVLWLVAVVEVARHVQ
ncbi:MAG TPA: hypothetical protein VN017_01560 [Pseudoxanthomonas sp.]|nr:hypothetical protein [Pseudoxanthomonas sp.]